MDIDTKLDEVRELAFRIRGVVALSQVLLTVAAETDRDATQAVTLLETVETDLDSVALAATDLRTALRPVHTSGGGPAANR